MLCIGEHGTISRPTTEGKSSIRAQTFFEADCEVFAESKKSVPVFNDKHLSATWDDAKWMYDKARELFVPFMAGSSVPVTWRRPELKLPRRSAS